MKKGDSVLYITIEVPNAYAGELRDSWGEYHEVWNKDRNTETIQQRFVFPLLDDLSNLHNVDMKDLGEWRTDNAFKLVDVSGTNITNLNCRNVKIKELKVSSCSELKCLSDGPDKITELIARHSGVTSFDYAYGKVDFLDLTACSIVSFFKCPYTRWINVPYNANGLLWVVGRSEALQIMESDYSTIPIELPQSVFRAKLVLRQAQRKSLATLEK